MWIVLCFVDVVGLWEEFVFGVVGWFGQVGVQVVGYLLELGDIVNMFVVEVQVKVVVQDFYYFDVVGC